MAGDRRGPTGRALDPRSPVSTAIDRGELRHALELLGDDASLEAATLRCQLLWDLGRTEDALSRLRALLARVGDEPWALIDLARRVGASALVLEALEGLPPSAARSQRALIERAISLAALKERDECAVALRELVARDGSAHTRLTAARIAADASLAQLAGELAASPDLAEDAEATLLRAAAALRARRFAEALDLAEQARRRGALEREVDPLRGIASAGLGHASDALTLLDRHLGAHPDDALAALWRAFARFALESDGPRLQRDLRALGVGVYTHPTVAPAFEAALDPAEPARVVDRLRFELPTHLDELRSRPAPSADPTATEAQIRDACLAVQRGFVRSPSAALAAAAALVERRPDSAQPLCYRGEMLLWAGDYDEARASFESALGVRRSTRWAWIGLGAVEALVGDASLALRHFQESIAVAGDEGPSLFAYRAEARLRRGDWLGARGDLLRGLEIRPSRTSSWCVLAVAAQERGDHATVDAAWDELRRAWSGFASEAAWSLGLPLPQRGDPPGAKAAVAARMLRMLRGNRSSVVHAFFDDAGEVRVAARPRFFP